MVAIAHIFTDGIGNDQIKFFLKLFFEYHFLGVSTKIVKTLLLAHANYMLIVLPESLFLGMQITLIAIGKTDRAELEELISIYAKRLQHYIKFEFRIIPDIKNSKNLSEAQQKEKEGELILAQLQPTDTLILLDEKGKQYTSMDFADFLQKKMNSGIKNLVMVIGGTVRRSSSSDRCCSRTRSICAFRGSSSCCNKEVSTAISGL